MALSPQAGRANQLPASAFQTYNAANASNIVAGPFALYTVNVAQLEATQLNVGFAEVDKKADGFNVVTTAAGPVNLTTATAVLDNAANLLSSIEPVIIGPGGVLYQTDGHHTFRALLDSAFGASNPTVYVNVIANFSNDTLSQFLAQMEALNLLFPVNNGVFQTVNLNTGSPLPNSLLGMTSDVYRGLEYSILKNKSSKLFASTANITGAIGAAIPGTDKETGFYEDFINADAYRGALGGLGLPYLSPGDIAFSTHWDLTGTNLTTGIPGFTSLAVNQLPGFILPATNTGTINITGTVTNAILTASGNAQLGALDGSNASGTYNETGGANNASFNGLRYMTVSGGGQTVTVGTQQATGVGPGFLVQLGTDNNTSSAGAGFTDADTIELSGSNTYTGGTTITAGRLIITSDASLGAAAVNTAINLSSVAASIEADNGIIFNSLTEGNGTIQINASNASPTFTVGSPFVESRPIELAGEESTINLNGNVMELTNANGYAGGQLYSAGSQAGVSNAAGEDDITIDDDSSLGKSSSTTPGELILGTTANPNFYGNWIVGNNGTPIFNVSNDASLGNTNSCNGACPWEVGQIELNGGTFQQGASFTSTSGRSFFLGGGSQYDTNGYSVTWNGSVTDTQRTLLIGNSNASGTGAVGQVTFGALNIFSTAILGVDAGTPIGTASGTGNGTVVTFANGIVRGNNFANSTANATLFINPGTGATLGAAAGTNVVDVFSSGASTTLTNGIVPVWIITDNGGGSATNPYNFLTYGANGYTPYTGYTTSFGASNVVQVQSTESQGTSAAYALDVLSGKTLTLTGTLTVGDGTDPAGVILNGTAANISGGTLAFGASEAGFDVKATNTVSSAVTGTGGLTLSGSGTLNLTGTAGGLTGPVNIESGTLQLSTANFFNSGTTVWLSNVKSKPSNAILTLSASQVLSGLDSDGNNSAVNIANGVTLTVGDSNNWNSQLSSAIAIGTSGSTATALTKAGLGLLDLSSSGGITFGSTGGTINVNAGALRIANGVISASATNTITIASGAELQYNGNGGSILKATLAGAGDFNLLAGTVELTGNNTGFTGGTVLQVGSTLDITTQNALPAGNIVNSGGILNFDIAGTTTVGGATISYAGVMSDGYEAGGPNDLNDIAGATTNLGASNATAAACGSSGSSANPQGGSGDATCLSGNLVKDDSTNDNAANSNLTLSTAQQYSGFTAIEAGTVTLNALNAISPSSGVILGRVGGPINVTTNGNSSLNGLQTAGLILGTANQQLNGLASNPSSTTTNTNNSVFVSLNNGTSATTGTSTGFTLTVNTPSGAANTYGGLINNSSFQAGTLVFGGNGLEILDGSAMYASGGTTVSSGMLEIGDQKSNDGVNNPLNSTVLTSNVTVGANGTLLGHGEIIGAITNSAGGVVAPGGTIGTMTVSGSYTQASNSSLAIEVGPNTASQLAVSGAPGTASIGGTLAILPDAGTYSRGTSYTILTATGGVTGTFATVTNATPQLVFKPVYNADNVQLLLTGFTPASTSMSGNQSGVFNALNNAPSGSATDSLLNAIGTLSASAQSQALNQLLAFGVAGNASTVTVGMSTFQDAIGGRASADPEAGTDVKTAQLVTDDWLPIPTSSRYTVWTQGLGEFSTLHGTSSAPGQSSSVGGGLIGIETATDPSTRLGVSVGATSGSVSVQNMPQSGSINSYALGLYGGRWFGALGFDAEAMGAYNTSSTSRYISLNGLTAKGNTSGFGGGVSGAARYRIATALATVEPQLGLEYNHSGLNSYTETGGGAANLAVGAVTQNSLRSAAGAEVFRAISDPDGHTIVPEFRAAWLHQFLDTTAHVSEAFAATPTASFTTTGLDVGRDAALLEAGLSYKAPDSSITFYAQYDATLSSREIDHAIRGGFAVFW